MKRRAALILLTLAATIVLPGCVGGFVVFDDGCHEHFHGFHHGHCR